MVTCQTLARNARHIGEIKQCTAAKSRIPDGHTHGHLSGCLSNAAVDNSVDRAFTRLVFPLSTCPKTPTFTLRILLTGTLSGCDAAMDGRKLGSGVNSSSGPVGSDKHGVRYCKASCGISADDHSSCAHLFDVLYAERADSAKDCHERASRGERNHFYRPGSSVVWTQARGARTWGAEGIIL
eukprot:1319087-Amorphochlora_amoeboformis.AAC.1